MKKNPIIFLMLTWALAAVYGFIPHSHPVFQAGGTSMETIIDGFSIRVSSIGIDEWDLAKDTQEPQFPEPDDSLYIYDTDSSDSLRNIIWGVREIQKALNRKVGFGTVPYKGHDLVVVSFTAVNGMQIDFTGEHPLYPRYYTDECVLVLAEQNNPQAVWHMLNIRNGEDVGLATCTAYSGNGLLRSFYSKNPWNETVYKVQYRKNLADDFRNLCDLSEIFPYAATHEEDGGRTALNQGRSFWRKNNLFIASDDHYFRIEFTKTATPEYKPAAPEAPFKRTFPNPSPDVPDPAGIDYGMFDRTVEIDGIQLHLRRIPADDFRHLLAYYGPLQDYAAKTVTGIEEIRKALPGYRFITNGYGILTELRFGDRWRIFLDSEQERHYEYYPQEAVLVYSGGHGSDFGIDMGTGTFVDRNPGLTFYSPGREYRVTGKYNGPADWNELRLEKSGGIEGEYHTLVRFDNILRYFPENSTMLYYLNDFFWIGNTLYFKCGENKYGSVGFAD